MVVIHPTVRLEPIGSDTPSSCERSLSPNHWPKTIPVVDVTLLANHLSRVTARRDDRQLVTTMAHHNRPDCDKSPRERRLLGGSYCMSRADVSRVVDLWRFSDRLVQKAPHDVTKMDREFKNRAVCLLNYHSLRHADTVDCSLTAMPLLSS